MPEPLHPEIRESVRRLCAEFPGSYWQALDRDRIYPTDFVRTLTEAGFLSVLVPEEYGGAGLGLSAATAILEEIHRSGCNGGACHAQMYTMGTILKHGSPEQKARYLPRIREACSAIREFICIDRPSFEVWLADQDPLAPDLPEAPDDVAFLASSGGTTGRPKGVQITNRNIEAMNSIFWACMPVKPRPVHLMVAPMTHAAGVCSFPLLAYGGTNIFMGTADPGAILAAIEKHRVTHIYMPPTLIYMLLAHPDVRKYDYSSLQHLVYASAPMSVDKLVEAIEVFGPVLTQTYGQAEACMICTFFSPEDHVAALETNNRHRLASCGKVSPLVRLEAMDDQGHILPRGERGEIVVRGALVMKGYYNNLEATAEASAFGWHHTGDIGVIDKDGFVYIVDRKKDMIISGGFNVFPSEVEQVLWGHPAVQDCAVIGVPDEKWGESVKAVVELKPGATASAEELISLAKEKLGGVKAPKSVDFIAALPRSPVGKVLKKTLREPYWAGHERKI